MSKKADLFRNQSTAYLSKPFYCSQTPPISATDTTNSHPAITYCPPKNDAVLLISALTPYAVKPEPRTDSKPFRRRLVRKTGFGRSRRKTLQTHFRQSFESSPESRGSQTSGVLPVLFVHAKRIKPFSLFGKLRGSANLESAYRNRSFAPQQLKPFKETPRFCKPRSSPPKLPFQKNTKKTYKERYNL